MNRLIGRWYLLQWRHPWLIWNKAEREYARAAKKNLRKSNG